MYRSGFPYLVFKQNYFIWVHIYGKILTRQQYLVVGPHSQFIIIYFPRAYNIINYLEEEDLSQFRTIIIRLLITNIQILRRRLYRQEQ